MRPAVELYNLEADPHCAVNLAGEEEQGDRIARLDSEMTARLEEQGDPRMFGKGYLFDEYKISNDATRNFYERFSNGQLDKSKAGWVNESDFESEPLPQTPLKQP